MNCLEPLRRKLLFRAWHRGTREMDLLMGSFAEKYLPAFNEAQLNAFARFMEENDPDIYDWYMQRATPPVEVEPAILTLFCQFRFVGA